MHTSPAQSNRALHAAMVDSLSSAIIIALTEHGEGSAKELSQLLEVPSSTMSERLRRLHDDGLIECTDTKKRRGTKERFYTASDSAISIDEEEMAVLSSSERKRIAVAVAQRVANSLSLALGRESGEIRSDSCWCASNLRIDHEGWDELSAVYRRTYFQVDRIRKESQDRLRYASAEGTRVSSALLLFGLPD